MAIAENQIHLKNINLSYPVTSSVNRFLLRELVGTMIGGTVEVDRTNKKVQIHALNNINLHVKCGMRIALLGNNGAGKTTLLRVLAGILDGDSGSRFS